MERLQGISRSLLNHLHVVAKQKIKIGHRKENIELIEQYKGQILEHIYLFVNFKCETSLQTCVKIDRFIYLPPPKKNDKFLSTKSPGHRGARRTCSQAGRSRWALESCLGKLSWILGGERSIHAWGLSTNVHSGKLTFWEM